MTEPAFVAILGVLGVILTALVAMMGHLYKRVHDMQREIDMLVKARSTAWENRVLLDNHIDALEDHIRNDIGPPPPARPKLT
ncbi:hypothetical protein [Nesterenkonia suensis]